MPVERDEFKAHVEVSKYMELRLLVQWCSLARDVKHHSQVFVSLATKILRFLPEGLK